MKTLLQTIVIALVLFASSNFAQTVDSMKVLTDYSLFSEYHKNKDFVSALPYGWKVIEAQPERFSKWIYYKMEECFWSLHDSASTAPEMVKSVEDTIIYFYDLAIKYRAEDKGYFEARKAYVSELWLSKPADETIPLYEQAIAWQPELSSFYYNRLGQLYINNDDGTNEYKQKAIDIYAVLAEREPENPVWTEIPKGLFESVDTLLEYLRVTWENDPQNE
ncbi:MAG TPA: hypothetical protein PLH53_14880, partial [Ignavibacteriaceae bacterium]|nr:hypothetical protein [Ignavibacteriaceae bacterium]